MKALSVKTLRENSVEELEKALLEEQMGLYHTRKDLVFRRITDTSTIKSRRHNIARILTVMTEKKKEVSA